MKNPGNALGELVGIIILLFVMLGTTYRVTLGRGPEYRWNGYIFAQYSNE